MKKYLFLIIKIFKRMIYGMIAVFAIILLLYSVWENILVKPIKIENADLVDKIEISYSDNVTSYKRVITQKDLIKDIISKMGSIKAKNVFHGGGGDGGVSIFISIYIHDEQTDYIMIYGDQIALYEATKTYRMSEQNSEKVWKYLKKICEHEK